MNKRQIYAIPFQDQNYIIGYVMQSIQNELITFDEHLIADSADPKAVMIPASDIKIGCTYQFPTGRRVSIVPLYKLDHYVKYCRKGWKVFSLKRDLYKPGTWFDNHGRSTDGWFSNRIKILETFDFTDGEIYKISDRLKEGTVV